MDATTLAHARVLRANLTDAEKKLWQILRGKQLGARFRKQHPLPPYVLDFYCAEHRLAIEVDGGQHNREDIAISDAARTAGIKSQGIRVLRFWNDEVLQNLEGVVQRILDVLKGPHPGPPPPGEGDIA